MGETTMTIMIHDVHFAVSRLRMNPCRRVASWIGKIIGMGLLVSGFHVWKNGTLLKANISHLRRRKIIDSKVCWSGIGITVNFVFRIATVQI